jgi:cytochrome c oxidase assembly protein subunit 15
MNKEQDNKAIIIWLMAIIFMVICMVFIGGITRLTDSGLSMVEWRPLVGAIPPLNEAEWNRVFLKYQSFPEFQKVNFSMTLGEFKQIFFWEYFHRLWGRLIGLVFFLPFVYFTIKKKIPNSIRWKVILSFVLGGLQGLMGWYMVKSGLVNRPDVSHLRLCAHLVLAFGIIGQVLLIILELKFPRRNWKFRISENKLILSFFVLLCLQIIYGAFVAGLDAGLTHNTFPKMGRDWLPSAFNMLSLINGDLFNHIVIVQFIHRCLAWGLCLIGVGLVVKLKSIQDANLRMAVSFCIFGLVIQFALGVSTLLLYIPIGLASMHQMGALFLFILAIRALFFSFTDTNQHSKKSL